MAKKKEVETVEELTPKQEMFCQEYLIDLNAKQAAIRAGYSENAAQEQGSRLLSYAKVQAKIEELQNVRLKRLNISQDYVITTIIDTIERCKQAEPVMIKDMSGIMVESGEYKFDANAVLKGAEMLGKHIGFFEKDNKQSKQDVIITGIKVTDINGDTI